MSSFRTISELRSLITAEATACTVRAQAEEINRRESSNGKPYFELRLRDASGQLTLRAWNDTPAFASCESLSGGEALEVEGEFFANGQFGLDARRWKPRVLSPEEAAALYGGPSFAESRDAFEQVEAFAKSFADPRLRALCERFLADYGSRFARAAAARLNHHATRGGLLAHTLQMLRAAEAVCTVYPGLNRDLLLAGTLLHDVGKLWETCPPEQGFVIARDIRGELLGHITIGIEVINSLWKLLPLEQWKSLSPPSDDVRLHLLHLIASHHGQLEFGSPVLPKTPEAIALNAIDNLDAKLQMLSEALTSQPEIAPGIYDRARALNVNPIRPLAPFVPEPVPVPPAR